MNLIPNFYPMRPTATGKIPGADMLAALRNKFIIQPKLNGDRAVLWVLDGEIYIQNRHGAAYTFMVRNRGVFSRLPIGTVLDGEVFGGNFLPFEALCYGDLDLTTSTATARCLMAKKVCAMLGVEWVYDEPDAAWLAVGKANGTQWEGIVCKLRNAAYAPCKKAFHESPDWFKFKWA